MQNLAVCLNIIAPIFILVGLGCCLRLLHVTNNNFIEVGSKLLFHILLPCSLFLNLYSSDFSSLWNPRLAVFVVAVHLGTVLLLSLTMPRFFKNREKCGIVVQGAFRGNVVLLGLPLAMQMYGAAGMGLTSVVMAYSVPLYNILGVVILSVFSGGEGGEKIHWGGVLLKVLKNPLVVGTVLAVPFALFHLRLPEPVTGAVSGLGSMASTFGLILLGAQIRFPSMRRNKAPIAAAVIIKLVLFPLAVMALAMLCGFSNQELGALFILVSAPMSVSSFVMASNMGGEGELAGQMVFVSTAFSLITLLGGLYSLTLLGIL